MQDATAIWRSKTDDEVMAAAGTLSDYTEEGESIIRAELRRRGLPEPPDPIGRCLRCGRAIHLNDPGERCSQCGEPFPADIRSRLGLSEPDSRPDDDVVTVATFPNVIEASLARSALEASGIPAVVPLEAANTFSFPSRIADIRNVELRVRVSDRDRAIGILKAAGHK